MKPRKLSIRATIEATGNTCSVVCSIGGRKYETRWARTEDGYLQHVGGSVFHELDEEDWVLDLLEALESGAYTLTLEAAE